MVENSLCSSCFSSREESFKNRNLCGYFCLSFSKREWKANSNQIYHQKQKHFSMNQSVFLRTRAKERHQKYNLHIPNTNVHTLLFLLLVLHRKGYFSISIYGHSGSSVESISRSIFVPKGKVSKWIISFSFF